MQAQAKKNITNIWKICVGIPNTVTSQVGLWNIVFKLIILLHLLIKK